MIKWYWYVLKPIKKNSYFGRFNEKLNYENFKKKNWHDQLQISFKSDNNYSTKKKFFERYFQHEYISYVKYLKKNVDKNKKILSIGSGRGIAELKLIQEGYNITLSDIDYPSGLKDLKRTFKKIKYIKFNIFKEKLKNKYDYIICLNLIYAFDKKKLENFFKKIEKVLKKDGVLIISPGGSTLNISKLIYNNIYLPVETFFLYIYFLFTNKRFSYYRFHNGYIHSDQNIISVARKKNYYLTKKIVRSDNLTEFQTSKVIWLLIKKSLFFKWLFGLLGKSIPYVNFFCFKKINNK